MPDLLRLSSPMMCAGYEGPLQTDQQETPSPGSSAPGVFCWLPAIFYAC